MAPHIDSKKEKIVDKEKITIVTASVGSSIYVYAKTRVELQCSVSGFPTPNVSVVQVTQPSSMNYLYELIYELR